MENRLIGLGLDANFARTRSGVTESYLVDALGSTLELRDAAQNQTVEYTYDPYGNTASSAASTNGIKYTGREQDLEDLYYYRNRYYKPSVGRFISEDPIGLAGGSNLYAYVRNNPVNYIDADGKNPVAVAMALARLASAGYAAYKIYDYYDSMSNYADTIDNYQNEREITDQAYSAAINGTKIPDNFNENARNDAMQDVAKAGANAAMKGAKLPGTSASGPVTAKCPK